MSLRERGLTRAIGMCNFNLPMIRRAVELRKCCFMGCIPLSEYRFKDRQLRASVDHKGVVFSTYVEVGSGYVFFDKLWRFATM